MAKRSAAQRRDEVQPALPEVLVSPSKAEPHQRDAYWLELLQEPEKFKDAVQTEELWPMLKSFPEALWGDRISIFIYRLPDDDGMMVKNAEGQAKYIKPVIRFCIDEDWVATKHGGGKYQLYLKLDDTVIRKHTFRIDGAPKVAAGQTVEIAGKEVSVGTVTTPPAADTRSDVATIIDANSRAEEKRTEMLLSANRASIELVKEQASAATKPDASNGIVEKLLTMLMERVMQPPPTPVDPIDSFVKLQTLIHKNSPEPEPEKEGALNTSLELVERLTGKSVADLMKPSRGAADANEYGWVAPVVGAVQQFIGQIPAIMQEARISRDQEFRRQVWLRTAQPGTPAPAELLANNPPVRTPAQPAAPAAPQPGAPPDPAQLVPAIVQIVINRFDRNPKMGYQCAAAIDALYGEQIEACPIAQGVSLAQLLADESQMIAFIAGTPVLAQRSQDVRWHKFQDDFMAYTEERWGEPQGDEDDEPEKSVTQMPPRTPLPDGAA